MINIPKFFHEILGEKQVKIELLFIFLLTAITTSFLFIFYHDFLKTLPIFNQSILFILTLDISGGVIANLTYGTDRFYSKSKKARKIFIAIHIQPLLIFLLAKSPLWIAFILWAYTIFCALILEVLKDHPSQKVFAGFDFMIATIILFAFESSLSPFVFFLMLLFLFKVLYSFSVNHYLGADHEK
jgi:hypothetical protein